MANPPEQTPQVEPKLDRSAPVADNVSAQSSTIWSSSLASWRDSEMQMSPWKDADVGSKGFSPSRKLLSSIERNQSTPGSADSLEMSIPVGEQKLDMQRLGLVHDGTLNKDGQPRKEGEPVARKQGEPAAQLVADSSDQSGARKVRRNASQNGLEEKLKVAPNGVAAKPPSEPVIEGEEERGERVEPGKPAKPKSDQVDPKKDATKPEEQKRVEEQKKLESAMFDKNLSAEQKLSAARELVKRGVTSVNGVDESGAKSSLRLEALPASAGRDMVHVFSTKEGGREKTALRGISREDGSWEQQRDRRTGRKVSYEGKGAADLNALRPEGSEVQPKPDGTRPGESPDRARPEQAPDHARPDAKGDRRVDAPEKLEPRTDQSTDDPKAKLYKMFDDARRQAGGRVGRMVSTDQGVYLKSDFDVDVDGSPRAKQIDRYGSTQTSYSYRNGRYVNAEEVPYIVLPKDKYKALGVKLGDMALVHDTKTGRIAAAVFADAGPNNKTGEGSIYLGKEGLGLKGLTPNNGIEERRFEYLVKPGTNGGTRPRNQAEMLQRIDAFKRQMGLIK